MRHDFKEDPERRERNCQVCGASYHCGACGEGSSMLGHHTKDDEGYFFHCQDRERFERHITLRRTQAEAKERAEYARLRRKFERPQSYSEGDQCQG